MKQEQRYLFPLILLCLSGSLYGQSWSGIIDPTRAINWSSPGVVGGVPPRTTICSSLTSSATYTQINTAIAACPRGQVVFLAPGTYNLAGGIVMANGVTLRGAGADQTFLVFTGNSPCGGLFADVCFMGENTYYGSPWVAPGGTQAATWPGGYSAGTTQITLTSVGSSGLSVGQYIYLDQANSSADNGNFFVCDNTTAPCSLEGGAPGRTVSGVDRNEIQIVKITAISGSTYTITPGLYAQNWASSFSPGAWWPSVQLQNAGIENLSMDHTNSIGGKSGVTFFNAFNCWVKGVRSLKPARNHIWFWQAAHNQVQDSYFFGTQNAASQSYGTESFISSDNLVINNIFQQVTAPIMMGPSQGSVFAYNFSVNDTYIVATWLQQAVAIGHDAGVIYNLFEGNNGSGYWGDVFHGTSGLNTVFRNRAVGWESGKTQVTVPIQLESYNRYDNIIGNVLGQYGYHTAYQTSSGTGASASIYDLGAGNTEGVVTILADPLVASTLMRWGNYDVVNAAVRFINSEVPSGISPYGNPVPASHALPPSFYLNAKPSWWPSAKAWPPIGPDVTGGNIPNLGGFAYTIPAQDCFTNVMGGPPDGTGSVLAFNANNCYTQSGPAPPTNLTVIVK